MTLLVAGLLLLLFAAAGLLTGRATKASITYVLGTAVLVGAALLFVPVHCETGRVATPFNDVSEDAKPTGCADLVGLELPEFAWLAGDTTGYGLTLAALGVAFGSAALALGRPPEQS